MAEDKKVSPKFRIRRDDFVVVTTGKDKPRKDGRRSEGRVLAVDRGKGRVLVEGVNYRKHHTRVRQTQHGNEGGIEDREGWIDISNVAIVDPQTKKPARVGIKVKDDGSRVRYTVGKNASGAELD